MNKEKLISWLKNPYSILLILILIFSFVLLLKYFNVNNALWADEASYLNAGKYIAFEKPFWSFEIQRPLLFPLLIAFVFKLGLGEVGVRFIAVLIPALLTVFLTYLIGKKLYDEKIGLIAAFIMSVNWILLFNTGRVHSDILTTLLNMLALFFFWQYLYNKRLLYPILIAILLGLGFLIRFQTVLVLVFMIIYLIITQQHRFLKDKNWYYMILIGLIIVIPYLIWNYIQYKNPFAFIFGYYDPTGIALRAARPIAWWILGYFKLYSEIFFFIFFLIGLVTFYKLFIGFDYVTKNKDKNLQADFFILLWLVIYIVYWVFINRNIEDRHFLPAAFAIFIVAAKGITLISNYIKKYSRITAIALIVIILLIGIYPQLKTTSDIVNVKKDSFMQARIAGEWIKEHTTEEESAIGNNVLYEMQYYANRPVFGILPEDKMLDLIKETNAKYFVLGAFLPSEQWVYEFPQKHNMKPVQAYPVSPGSDQPILIIYEIPSSLHK